MHIIIKEVEEKERIKVWKLSHDAYVDFGYIEKQQDGIFKHYYDFEYLEETKILIASLNDEIVGTCSITFDGPQLLPVDQDYKYELNIIRNLDIIPIVCCWRLATTKKCRYKSRVVIELMKEIAKILIVKNPPPMIISEINPKHYKFYNKFWGFKEISRRDWTQGLSNAPSILIRSRPEDYGKYENQK